MKKLFVAAMTAVVAFSSVSAFASSKLLIFNTVEVVDEKVYTHEEMLKIVNESAQAEKASLENSDRVVEKEAALQTGLKNDKIKMNLADFFSTGK